MSVAENPQNNINKSTIYWAWIGKVSLILSVIYTLVQLFKPIFYKEYDVDAVGIYKPYDIPENLFSSFDLFICNLDSIAEKNINPVDKSLKIKVKSLDFLTSLLEMMKKEDYNIPDNVSEDITNINKLVYPEQDTLNKSKFDYSINLSELRNCFLKLKSHLNYETNILKIDIYNKGDREIDNIKLKIAGATGYVRIKENLIKEGKPGDAGYISDFIESIDIDKIEPRDELDLIVWLKEDINSNKIKLTYSGKIIDIDYKEFIGNKK